LAVDRLEVISLKPKPGHGTTEPVDEKQLITKFEKLAEFEELIKEKKTPIESSHCFGPEEEYKLRNIMCEIGLENLSLAFGQMATALKDKNKKSFYDIVCEKFRYYRPN